MEHVGLIWNPLVLGMLVFVVEYGERATSACRVLLEDFKRGVVE